MKPILLVLTALAISACSAPNRTHKADTLLDQGDYDGAMARYAAALAESPDDPALARKLDTVRRMLWRVHREHAASALERGDLDLAREELTRVLELDPGDAEARKRLAEVETRRTRILTAVDEAGRALEAGEADRARTLLEPHLAHLAVAPDALPLLRKIDGVRREESLRDVEAALNRQDFEAARTAARKAASVLPVDPRATMLLRQAEAGLEATSLAAEAESVRGAGDYRAAMTLARRALSRRAGVTVAEEALAAAKRDGARINLEAAARALGAGQAKEALDRLAVAAELDPTIEAAGALAEEVRTRLATDLVAKGAAHETDGRHALALLHFLRAQDVKSDHPDLGARIGTSRVAVEEEMRVLVTVDDLENNTRASLDVLGITRSVLAKLRSGSLPPWIDLGTEREGVRPTDVHVSGHVGRFETWISAPVTHTKSLRYVKEIRHEPNPAHGVALRRLRKAESNLRKEERDLADERRKLGILVNNPWTSSRNRNYRRDPDQVESAYEMALVISRSRVRDSERVRDRAYDEVVRAQDALDATPSTVERKIMATHRRRETVRIASGRATAFINLNAAQTGEGIARETAAGGVTIEDTEAPAFEPAGLAHNPLELPSDEELSDLLTDSLVTAVATRIRQSLEALAERDLPGKDAATTDPDVQERWARYLLSGVSGDGGRRREIAEALRLATGLVVPAAPGEIRGDRR